MKMTFPRQHDMIFDPPSSSILRQMPDAPPSFSQITAEGDATHACVWNTGFSREQNDAAYPASETFFLTPIESRRDRDRRAQAGRTGGVFETAPNLGPYQYRYVEQYNNRASYHLSLPFGYEDEESILDIEELQREQEAIANALREPSKTTYRNTRSNTSQHQEFPMSCKGSFSPGKHGRGGIRKKIGSRTRAVSNIGDFKRDEEFAQELEPLSGRASRLTSKTISSLATLKPGIPRRTVARMTQPWNSLSSRAKGLTPRMARGGQIPKTLFPHSAARSDSLDRLPSRLTLRKRVECQKADPTKPSNSPLKKQPTRITGPVWPDQKMDFETHIFTLPKKRLARTATPLSPNQTSDFETRILADESIHEEAAANNYFFHDSKGTLHLGTFDFEDQPTTKPAAISTRDMRNHYEVLGLPIGTKSPLVIESRAIRLMLELQHHGSKMKQQIRDGENEVARIAFAELELLDVQKQARHEGAILSGSWEGLPDGSWF